MSTCRFVFCLGFQICDFIPGFLWCFWLRVLLFLESLEICFLQVLVIGERPLLYSRVWCVLLVGFCELIL